MKIRSKATTDENGRDQKKPKRRGVSLEDIHAPARKVTPILRPLRQGSIDAFDTILEQYNVIEGTNLPPLNRCGIALEGAGKSGKSALIAGCQQCITIKCYDGSPIVPRTRGKVIFCPDFKTFKELIDSIRLEARRQGKDSFYTMIHVDPIATLIRWKCDELVARYNLKHYHNSEGTLIEGNKDKLIESVSQMRDRKFGPWGEIADYVERLLVSFGEIGWGWVAPLHYQMKPDPETEEMRWLPNVPPTTAERVCRMADVRIITEREGDEYRISYIGEVTQNLGARVPLVGQCRLPNYLDKGTDPSVTSWDYLNSDYVAACKEFEQDNTRFRKLYEDILSELSSEEAESKKGR